MSSESLAMACFAAAGVIGVGLAYGSLVTGDCAETLRRSRSNPSLAAPGVAIAGHQSGWLRVLDAPALVAMCKLAPTLQQIQRESKLAQSAWTRDIAPAIARYLDSSSFCRPAGAPSCPCGRPAAHTIEWSVRH